MRYQIVEVFILGLTRSKYLINASNLIKTLHFYCVVLVDPCWTRTHNLLVVAPLISAPQHLLLFVPYQKLWGHLALECSWKLWFGDGKFQYDNQA